MDRLELIPGDVRGGGNITTLKDDFKTDENTNVYGIHLGEESTFVNGKLMTVYNSRLTTYHSSVADKWALTFTAPRVVSPGDTVTVNFTALCGDDAVGSTEARLVLRSINGETVFWEDTMVISSGSGSFSVTVPSVDTVLCEWVLFISHYFYQNASCHRSVVVADLDFDFNVVGDKSILQTGETCNVVGVLTGTIGDDVIGIPGQTVNFYELWTPGLRVSSPKVIQSGDNIDIKAQLIDTVDGSLVREAGHTVNVYMDDAPVPVPTTLYVNFDKTILSYADGDSAYVIVGVYDQYGDAMPNQIVSGSINEGAPFDLETDVDGRASFSYVSQGAGDVVFTVECMNLQETYSIEDCLNYDIATKDNTSNYTTKNLNSHTFSTDKYIAERTLGSSANTYYSLIYPSTTLPTDYEISVDMLALTKEQDKQFGLCVSDTYTETYTGTNQCFLYANSNRMALGYRVSGSLTNYGESSSYNINTWYTFKIKVSGTTVTVQILNGSTVVQSWNGTLSNIQSWKKIMLITGGQSNTIYWKNLKIKPL